MNKWFQNRKSNSEEVSFGKLPSNFMENVMVFRKQSFFHIPFFTYKIHGESNF